MLSGNFEEDEMSDDELEDEEAERRPRPIKSPFNMSDFDRIISYDKGVDYAFFERMNIKVVKYQPWQLGLFHDKLKGKFVWYPRAGTLMFETEAGISRIGNRGEFPGTSNEFVYSAIIKKINEQTS